MFSGLPPKAEPPPDLRTTPAASSWRTPPSRPRASTRLDFPDINSRMLPVTLVVQGMLVHVNALILPLGVLFQFANSSPEPRQTCFITRYFKEFFGMRVVERPCPISHDPCSLFRLRRQLFANAATAASRVAAMSQVDCELGSSLGLHKPHRKKEAPHLVIVQIHQARERAPWKLHSFS